MILYSKTASVLQIGCAYKTKNITYRTSWYFKYTKLRSLWNAPAIVYLNPPNLFTYCILYIGIHYYAVRILVY